MSDKKKKKKKKKPRFRVGDPVSFLTGCAGSPAR